MSDYGLYRVPVTPALDGFLGRADVLDERLQAAKADHPDLWPTVLSKLRVDWTYHSNTIEGTTLSRGETHFFLTEGLTVEGKPFKDFIDARNHAEAIDFLYKVVSNQRAISVGLIKEINALLLFGITHTPARTPHGRMVDKRVNPGQYKTQPNHVEQADGTIHWYVEPLHVPARMDELVDWLAEHIDHYHPIISAALVHYNLVRIHPFDDGNGRGARILMNLILMKKGFFPAVIRSERKRYYLDSLKQADDGDITAFIEFIAGELIDTQEKVIADLEPNTIELSGIGRQKRGKTTNHANPREWIRADS